MTLNLIYKIKRFFQGESGVVVKVESIDPIKDKLKNYERDDFANIPTQVTFRNPLGKLVTARTPLTLVPIDSFKDRTIPYRKAYKQYKVDDNFP